MGTSVYNQKPMTNDDRTDLLRQIDKVGDSVRDAVSGWKETQPCVSCKGTMHLKYKTRNVTFGGLSKDVEVLGYWCDSCEEGIVEKEGSDACDIAYAELNAEVQAMPTDE